jgi:hypothetical protein
MKNQKDRLASSPEGRREAHRTLREEARKLLDLIGGTEDPATRRDLAQRAFALVQQAEIIGPAPTAGTTGSAP